MASVNVGDVSEQDFDAEVLERSYSQPVLVDFWAPWCGPCRMLGPVLEALAQERQGAFFLAKVNTEEAQRIAASYRISGIPAVKLFQGGKVVAEFTGALPKAQVVAFLDQHLPSEAKEAYLAGLDAVAQANPEAARAHFERAVALDESLHPARIALAKLLLQAGETAGISEILAPIGAYDEEREAADAIVELLAFGSACEDAGGLATARAASESSPKSAEAQLRFGQCLAAAGQHEAALEALLSSVGLDKGFEDEAARRAMLTLFQILGPRSELSNAFRRRLSIYL